MSKVLLLIRSFAGEYFYDKNTNSNFIILDLHTRIRFLFVQSVQTGLKYVLFALFSMVSQIYLFNISFFSAFSRTDRHLECMTIRS